MIWTDCKCSCVSVYEEEYVFGLVCPADSVFLFFSVSVAELQTHTELDSDADGTFSETEAQVYLLIFFSSFSVFTPSVYDYSVISSPGVAWRS